MIRKIIHIDEEKCTGCGLCANACHEGAIAMVNGKAKLMRDDFCDGLGDCLPACPTDAISFVEREADAYDEAAVLAAKAAKEAGNANAKADSAAGSVKPVAAPATAVGHESHHDGHGHGGGCPGSRSRSLQPAAASAAAATNATGDSASGQPSELRNWPVQIKLAPLTAPYFDGANLLIAADCCAYSYASFHHDFIRNKACLIGCPKLDGVDYSEKLTQIIAQNDIKSVTITRMQVPCCGGLEQAAKRALQQSGKFIPWQVVTFTLDGRILEE
jgi:Pyruvate/2-oxoacid:ferredoxin oxidoreductase delta subunit